MQDIVNEKDIQYLFQVDPVIKHISDLYGLPPAWSRPPGFVSLAKIILEQQVSLNSAIAHFNKLNNYMGTITPENILKLSDEEFRECHITRQKTKYLRILAEAILQGYLDLDQLQHQHPDDVRQTLTALKGIGNWTTDIYLMFCLRSKDIFPIGDIAVVNTIKELYQVDTKEEMHTIAQKWSPNRSLAVHFLWHYYLKKRNRAFPF